MTETDFSKLMGQLQALAPMCNFEMPEILCGNDELYFRGLYDRMNKEITSLVNLVSRAGEDSV